jgi:glutamate dehydrogenase (NAD(P)+)
VIVSYFEWVQDLQQLFWSEQEVTSRLEQVMDSAFKRVLDRAQADKVSHRTAALSLGVEKLRSAKRMRGLFP